MSQITDIFTAAQNGDLKALKDILAARPDDAKLTDLDGRTPLHWAAWEGHAEACAVLLHFAAAHGHKDVVAFLLDKGVDINATDKFGQTPLHRAAAHGCKDVVAFLLDKGVRRPEPACCFSLCFYFLFSIVSILNQLNKLKGEPYHDRNHNSHTGLFLRLPVR